MLGCAWPEVTWKPRLHLSPERLDALCGMHDVTDKKDEATRMVACL